MARKLICGFETGDTAEITSLGAGYSVVSSTKRSGGYALRNDATVNADMYFDLGAANAIANPRARVYLQVEANSGTNQSITIFESYNTSILHNVGITIDRAGTIFSVSAYDSAFSIAGSASIAALNTGQWYRFEIDCTPGAGTGAVTVYIDGTSVLALTAKQFGTGPIQIFKTNLGTGAGAGFGHWVDDFVLDDAALPGDGAVIARQITPGAPTYDNWTKVG